ncbi:MAG TPA: SDR family NAD(P)-dependent oxidoreductase [Solirubrobacterales bacterium]|jgi:NAD(P)-dependent dehydrogenase (short-subunit alcohol dehydrogenase family)|nr:SDR family NAD(P)-dependent oxidoreductase [Solirubrobacterales bacterium]
MNDSSTSPTASGQDLIRTPFGAETTALEVVEGIDLSGKRAVVTGGASGIGVETVRALAQAGAAVTIAARKLDAAEAVAANVRAGTGNDDVALAALELTDRDSIERFAAAWDGPLDILVDNAGVMALQELTLAPDGHEMQFATNHLGHFRLALALHEALAAAPSGARVVSLSSRAHLSSPVVFDDIDFAFRPYTPESAYAQSKTANVLFAVEAARRWADDGIVANAVHPGPILETGLARHMDQELLKGLVDSGTYTFKTTEQGASTSVLVAASPLLDGITGRYFEDCNEAHLVSRAPEGTAGGVAPYALDPSNATRLWNLSLDLIA